MPARSRGLGLGTWALLASAVPLMPRGGVLANGTRVGHEWAIMSWGWGAQGAPMPVIRFGMLHG